MIMNIINTYKILQTLQLILHNVGKHIWTANMRVSEFFYGIALSGIEHKMYLSISIYSLINFHTITIENLWKELRG